MRQMLSKSVAKNEIMKKQMNQKVMHFCDASKYICLGSLLTAIVLFSATVAYSEGFRNPPPGTFNLGRAGGRIAQVDDSSAVQQNPANLG